MIGDVLTSSILCEAIKLRFRESEIHYLINAHTTPVLENNPFIDKLIIYTPEIEKSAKAKSQFKKQLKAEAYDTVIDVYSKIGSAFLTKATGAKNSVGYHKWYTHLFYTDTLRRRKKSYTLAGLAIENRMLLLEQLTGKQFDAIAPKIYLTEQEKTNAKHIIESCGIDLSKKLYQISALGSGSTKTYPLPYLATLLDYIVESTDAQLIFNYIPSQVDLITTLYNHCAVKTRAHIFLDCYGKSLREFIAITSHCDAIIGNEGGAINMAKAIDIPTFAIFCPWINKEEWSVYDDHKRHVSVHLYDYIDYNPRFNKRERAPQKVAANYQQFKPELIVPKLSAFLKESTVVNDGSVKMSATIITYNEERNIARCIESLLPVVDEVVIVDSYSTDKTQYICEQYPVRFIQHTFEGHIQQKNVALDLATHNHIVSLDADEALSKELQTAIQRVKRDFNKSGYIVKRYNNYCGQWINHTDWSRDKKLRVFDKTKARWGGVNPHDKVQMSDGATVGSLKGEILHWVHATHEEHRQKTEKFSTIASKEYYKRGRKASILDLIIKPTWIFIRSYIIRMGFLDGRNGFILCTFSAKTTYLKYCKLRRLRLQKKTPN